MPHPSSPSPQAATVTIEPPTTAPTRITTNLIAQAHTAANCIFQAHVQTVLQHTSSVGLRRLFKSRVHAHFQDEIIRNNNADQPLSSITEDDDPSVLFRENPNLLQVTREDVDVCYSFAKRVGMKWADELQRQGCLEFSDIVLQLVNRGHYLEPNSTITDGSNRNDNDDEPNNHNLETADNDEANNGNKKFATAYAALHSLRRYEPDCDGSGKPYEHLRPIRQHDNDKSARKIIQQIDEMARHGQTLWHHGWDAIEEAVKRNRERIDYSKVTNQDEEVQEGMKSRGTKKRVHFEGDPEQQIDDAGEVLKKSRFEESDAEHSSAVSRTVNKPDGMMFSRGRPPSSIGDTVYSWESILQSMSSQERRNLIMSSIHPPYPFEETDVDDGSEVIQSTANAEEECGVNVVGALKEVGLTHLFEQTRHLFKEATNDLEETKQSNSNEFESFLGASETRASFKSQQLNRMKKKAMRRAEKERFGRRAPVMGEKSAEYYGFGTAAGKVRLTEEDQGLTTITKRDAPISNMMSVQIQDEPERQRWLDFDLGECFLEEIDEDSNQSERKGSAQDKTKKRFLAFRSLEMAIMD